VDITAALVGIAIGGKQAGALQSRTMEGMAAMEANPAHRYGNGNDCMGSERVTGGMRIVYLVIPTYRTNPSR